MGIEFNRSMSKTSIIAMAFIERHSSGRRVARFVGSVVPARYDNRLAYMEELARKRNSYLTNDHSSIQYKLWFIRNYCGNFIGFNSPQC